MNVLGNYQLRPLEEKDLKTVLAWRNADAIHSQMLTDHKITWEEHYGWFQRMKEQTLKRNFVFFYQGTPIGYIGYTEFDEDGHTCSPGAYLAPGINAPKEAALCLFYTSIDYAFEYLGMVRLNTDVFADNKRALKLDTFLGYEIIHDEDHHVTKNGQEKLVYRLVLDKEKWKKHKEELMPYISDFTA